METQQHRLRFGPAGVDFEGRINFARMRAERAARARAELKKQGVAVALLMSPPNIKYAAGLRSAAHIGTSEYGVLFFTDLPDDTIAYQIAPTYLQLRYHAADWIKPENMRAGYRVWAGAAGAEATKGKAQKFAKDIKRDLQAQKLDKEALGYDVLSAPVRAALEAEGIKLVEAGRALINARRIKTDDEVDCMRMAGAIVDRAWWEFYANLRPGIAANELAAKAFEALWKYGAENVGMVSIRTGPDTAPIYLGTSPKDRIIQYGDLVYSDMYQVQYAGYNTCYYRTFKVGCKPTEKEKDWYKKTRDWLYAALDVVKPGATTADAAKKWPGPDVFKAYGVTTEEEIVGCNVAHGMGLAPYEEPIVSRTVSFDNPQVFEKGMTIAFETHFGEPFVGGCRLENIVVVTDNGWENLYTMPDEEIIVPTHSLIGG
jgi:Xaa-Pro aminopeptidase